MGVILVPFIPLTPNFRLIPLCVNLRIRITSLPLLCACAFPYETNIFVDTPKAVLIIPNPFLPLTSPQQHEEGDRLEIGASFDDQCGIFVELEDTFSEDHSLEEPYLVELSEVTPPMKVVDSTHAESSLDLAPTPPISSPSLLPSPFFIHVWTIPTILL